MYSSLNELRFSHYFIFIPLSDNRNSQYTSFIENLAASKYSYVGTERETNVIIN